MNVEHQRNCCVPSWETSSTAQVVSYFDNPIPVATTADAKCLITKLLCSCSDFAPHPFVAEKLSSRPSTMFPFRNHPQPHHVRRFANQPVGPVPQRVQVRVPQVEYTEFELSYRDNFIGRVIPVSCFFADIPIPGHPVPGYTYYQCATDVVTYSWEVLATKIPERVKLDGVLGKGLQAYEDSVHLGCIITAVHGFCFGWNRQIGRPNGSLDNIRQGLDTEVDSADKRRRQDIFEWFVQPLIIYLVKYVLPMHHQTLTLGKLCNTNIENVRTQQTRRSNRCAMAQWTEEWAMHAPFLGVERTITQGHYYPFSCLMDRVIVGFFQRIHNTSFTLLGPAGRDIVPHVDMARRVAEDRFYIVRN